MRDHLKKPTQRNRKSAMRRNWNMVWREERRWSERETMELVPVRALWAGAGPVINDMRQVALTQTYWLDATDRPRRCIGAALSYRVESLGGLLVNLFDKSNNEQLLENWVRKLGSIARKWEELFHLFVD